MTQVLGCPPVQVGVSAWVTVVSITQRVVQGYGVNPERGCKSGKKKMGTTDPRTEASFHTARIFNIYIARIKSELWQSAKPGQGCLEESGDSETY